MQYQYLPVAQQYVDAPVILQYAKTLLAQQAMPNFKILENPRMCSTFPRVHRFDPLAPIPELSQIRLVRSRPKEERYAIHSAYTNTKPDLEDKEMKLLTEDIKNLLGELAEMRALDTPDTERFVGVADAYFCVTNEESFIRVKFRFSDPIPTKEHPRDPVAPDDFAISQ
jgi:hypothetical protein